MRPDRITRRAALIVIAPVALAALGCSRPSGTTERSEPAEKTERWPTTESSSAPMDWDKLHDAYKMASGPEDLERRVNELYGGDEVVSIAVADVDDKTQLVTGFVDRNASGAVDEGEKLFAIRRELTSETNAQVQSLGYGPYAGHQSPFFSIASGMLMGSMMSRMFMPGYVPMYRQPYTTPGARLSTLQQSRSSYRAANPSQFQRSQSGRTYNRPTTTTRGSRGFGGGGRFGVRSKGAARRLGA